MSLVNVGVAMAVVSRASGTLGGLFRRETRESALGGRLA